MSDQLDDKEDLEESGEQFKMRRDPFEEAVSGDGIPSEINELRLEKISQRVTLISIMIPVLIVIVLVIAYLDIKKRVVQTEDSGAIEFRKLSSDLESRFSSLSLRQAKLEEALQTLSDQNNHAMASIQVRLENLNEAITAVRRDALGAKALDGVKADLAKQIESVSAAAGETGRQTAALLQELKGQVVQQGDALSTATSRVAELQKNIAELDNRKIDKQSLDLALRLETLKIETAVKTRMDTLQARLNALEKRLQAIPPRPPESAPTPAPAPAPAPVPRDNDLETQIIR